MSFFSKLSNFLSPQTPTSNAHVERQFSSPAIPNDPFPVQKVDPWAEWIHMDIESKNQKFEKIFGILLQESQEGRISYLLTQADFNFLRFVGSNGVKSNYQNIEEAFFRMRKNGTERIIQLLPFVPPAVQIQFFDRLTVFLGESITHLLFCKENALMEKCIEFFSLYKELDIQFDVVSRLCLVIGTLGSFHVSADQLVKLLRLVASGRTFSSGKLSRMQMKAEASGLILGVLGRMAQSSHPSSFFNFDGVQSGIQIVDPRDKVTFPNSGFTFCTWIRLESSSGSNYSRILSAYDAKNGFEILLKGNQIWIRIICNGKRESIQFEDVFIPIHRWKFISISRSKMSLFSYAEISLRVDDKVYTKEIKRFPSFSSLTSFQIGSASPSIDLSPIQPFKGQMSTVSLFNTVLSESDLKAIDTLGVDYKFQLTPTELQEFEAEIGVQVSFSNLEAIRKSLSLLYIPGTWSSNPGFIQDSSPKGQANGVISCNICTSKRLSDTIQSIGGVEILFPLIESLMEDDLPLEESVCVSVLGLIYKCLQHSKSSQADIARRASLSSLGFLMTRIHPKYLTDGVVRQFFAFAELFSPGDTNYKLLMLDIILNFDIWLRAGSRIQLELLTKLTDYVESNPQFFFESVGIERFFDILRKYFPFSPLEDEQVLVFSFSNEKEGNSKLSDEENLQIVSQILNIVKRILQLSQITKRDIKPLGVLLQECKDRKMHYTLLRWIPQLLDEVPNLANLIIDTSIPTLFHRLSNNPNIPALKILMLKVISSLVEHADKDRRQTFLDKGYFYIIFEYLQDIDHLSYSTIYEMLILQTSSLISQDVRAKSRHVIALDGLFDALMLSLQRANSDIINRFIEDLEVLIENQKNIPIILQISHWHYKLLQIGFIAKKESQIISLIAKILGAGLSIKNTYTHIIESVTFMKIYVAERARGYLPLKSFLEILISIASVEILKEESKDSSVWENFFHLCRVIEEFSLYTDEIPEHIRLEMAYTFVRSMDNLVRKSVESRSTTEAMHCNYTKRKGFSLRSIVTQDFTSLFQKGVSHVDPSVYVILFKLNLFLLENLGMGGMKSRDEIIPMLGLCILDVDDPQVPKPQFTNADLGIDAETGCQRMYFLIAQSFRSINLGNDEVINFVRPVLAKYRGYLSTTLSNPEARALLSQEIDYSFLKRKEPIEKFKEVYEGSWKIIRESPPLSIAVDEAERYVTTTKNNCVEKLKKLYNQSWQEHAETMKKHELTNQGLFKSISDSYSSLSWKERQRYEHWENSIRRKRNMLLNRWNDIVKNFSFGVGVWKVDNIPPFEIIDLTETSNDRQRPRIVLNPEGTSHRDASQYMFAEDRIPELQLSTPLTDTSMINFNALQMDEKGDGSETQDGNESSVNTEEIIEEEFVVVENTEKKLRRDSYEATLQVYEVEYILPLQSIRGILELTKSYIYFSINDEYEENPPKSEWHLYERQWRLKEIEKIFKRRYLLSHTAVELFLLDRTTVYINFPTPHDNEKFVHHLLKQNLPNLRFNAFPYTPKQLFQRSSMTEKWRRREISNFEYLMFLNTIANRTYNDLTQYFVMPWVIKDYTSETIDLNDPNIYRDLSKPIGALNPSRLKDVIERFESFSDPVIPPFHYGSHYSSCGTVLYYLIRVEPFTEWNIKLQGGTFDLADRLFFSVATSWHVVNVSTSDVKELVPEFFYLPEMFKNNNKLFLGVRQDGDEIKDVILPPWASSPEEFVRIQRMALESEYVSKNLHKWIDLIFGYKQRGSEALKAYNLFYYLTYEGSVDLSKIEDKMIKKSIITQLKNFGQTPSQLLTKPHPERNPPTSFIRPFYWKEVSQTSYPFFTYKMGEDSSSSIIHITSIGSGKFICIDDCRRLQIIQILKPKPLITLPNPVGSNYARGLSLHSRLFICIKDRWVISCGHFDHSIKCTSLFDKREVKQCQYNHKDIVTCLAMCEEEEYIVSASMDCTARIWKINSESKQPLKAREVIYGHDSAIIGVDVNSKYDLVVTTSMNGKCLIHRLYNGKFVKQINTPSNVIMNLVKITSEGHIILVSNQEKMMYVYNSNGTLLNSSQLEEEIYDMKTDLQGEYLFTGGSNGQAVVRSLPNLTIMKRYTLLSFPIFSIELRKIQTQYEIICGTGNRQAVYFSWNSQELESN